MQTSSRHITAISIILIFLASCIDKEEDQTQTYQPTAYNLVIPTDFPTQTNIPADNPLTVEGVKLGRYLYYDERLSGRADQGLGMSCGSCHKQAHSFENGTGFGYGTTGVKTHHTMLPHINLLWNESGLGWNGGTQTLEEVVLAVIPLESEVNSTWPEAVAAIKKIPMYPPLFEQAFGTKEITKERIAKAISQFIRTMISANSKYDRLKRGETTFTDSEMRGLVIFSTENGGDCFHCHGTGLFTTNGFYNNAKDLIFDTLNDRYSVTHYEKDKGAYKATTLRNIELTGPYMHDGRYTTLDEVINFYSEGLVYTQYVHPLMHKAFPPYGSGSQLNPQQKADLKAFLLTLTDSSFIHNPLLSNPFTQ